MVDSMTPRPLFSSSKAFHKVKLLTIILLCNLVFLQETETTTEPIEVDTTQSNLLFY